MRARLQRYELWGGVVGEFRGDAMYRVIVCAAAALLVAVPVGALLLAIAVQPSDDGGMCRTATDDEAIAACGRLLALNPEVPVAYRNRGIAYHGKGDYDRAIADYDQAIRLDPKNAVAYTSRGQAYDKKGD